MQDGGQEIEQDRPSKYTFEVKIAVQAEHAHARQSKLVAQLDHELKHILDPIGRFGSNPDVSTSSTHSDASV